VKLTINRLDRYSRGELLLRAILGFLYIDIPHSVCLAFFGIVSVIITFISWWSILFTGRYPRSLFEFQVGMYRWNVRWMARFYNLTDGYPAFGINATDEYTDLQITYPKNLSRGTLLLKTFFGALYVIFPHLLILFFALLWGAIQRFISWWVVLFTGNYPETMHEFNVGLIRWTLRVNLYMGLMSDKYPPFSGNPGGSPIEALLKKELNGFLSSLIGYIVIIVFLTAIGMLMWVFPGDSNILDNGYANLNTLFVMGPWVFMFLVPAVTMRLFAEEKRLGTIELLFTQPISDAGVILAKYLAGLVLIVFSLVPTLVYFGTVYYLGNPVGNLDIGGVWGSYVGLLFLGAGFVAIGVFCSSITDNQIISFVIAIFLSFFCYTGFDSISGLSLFGGLDSVILKLGIQEHYLSMSRGVLDTRDILYFLSLIAVFLLFTKVVLDSRKW